MEDSYLSLQVQQTPNPEAHVPADNPPLFKHSSLETNIIIGVDLMQMEILTEYSMFRFLTHPTLCRHHWETLPLGIQVLK